MTKTLKVVVLLNAVLLVWNLAGITGSAQRPPQTNADGIPFFNVNINPTDVPPMVNVNPHGLTPKVEVTQMPQIQIVPAGCADRRNLQTCIGRSIGGPLVITFLNLPAQTQTALSGRSLTLNSAQISSAIYLGSGQRLEFDKDVIYSGCQPQ